MSGPHVTSDVKTDGKQLRFPDGSITRDEVNLAIGYLNDALDHFAEMSGNDDSLSKTNVHTKIKDVKFDGTAEDRALFVRLRSIYESRRSLSGAVSFDAGWGSDISEKDLRLIRDHLIEKLQRQGEPFPNEVTKFVQNTDDISRIFVFNVRSNERVYRERAAQKKQTSGSSE